MKHYFSNSQNDARFDNADNIYQTWLALHEALKNRYFMNPNENSEDGYESTRMDVLIANSHGIFGGGANRHAQEFSKFFAYGNGNEYATGAIYPACADPNRTAEDIARLGVQAAAEFEDSTGLPVISYSIRCA